MQNTASHRRVLVTGGAGFLGRRLIAHLAEGATEIHATSRRSEQTIGRDAVTWHQLDLADEEATTRLTRSVRPDVIYHLAGAPVGRRDPKLVAAMLQGNLVNAVNVMSAGLADGGCRVVLAGSMEEPDPDDSASVASSPYSAAKGAATEYARMFHELWGLPVTVLRVAMAYGPAQPDVRKLVPYVVSSLLGGRAPELTSGTRVADWVYVDDVAEAFVAAGRAEGAAGRSIPIGSGTGVSVREVATLIGSLIDADRVLDFGAIDDRPMDDEPRVADPGPALALLGWRARTTLREGLQRTIEWYRAQAATPCSA